MGEKLKRSVITTQDGTVIITDPELGQSVSGRTLADAEAELRRRKLLAGTAETLPLHAANHPGHAVHTIEPPADLSPRRVDIVFQSPPCKHFSKAG